MFLPLLFGLVVAATTGTLVPTTAMPVPGRYLADVAWENAETLLIVSDKGVQRFPLRTRLTAPLVSPIPLPDGLPDALAVASDGASLVTVSHLARGGYAMRLSDRKRLSATRIDLLPFDAAVRGERACVLALRMMQTTDEAVWCGPVDKSWKNYQAVHRLKSGQDAFRHAFPFARAGALALAEDGSLYVVTSVEPGVFHYAPDGKLIETLGQSFDELVRPATSELGTRFATDVDGRYSLLLNKQPTIDDMVLTPRGPALVVRIAEKEQTRWELWWPRADGRTIPPTRLGMDRIGPFGHVQCDARGNALACVGAKPDKKSAADFHVSESNPYLWIFELPQ